MKWAAGQMTLDGFLTQQPAEPVPWFFSRRASAELASALGGVCTPGGEVGDPSPVISRHVP
jgi:hypothetical protein